MRHYRSSTLKFSIAVAILLISAYAYGQGAYRYSQPKQLDDGWETTDLRPQQDTAKVYRLFSQLQGSDHQVHSVLVVKDGQIVIEEYFDKYNVNEQHDLRSVTKSITSLLMGIAIDQGFVDHVGDPITKYLKHPVARKNLDARKDSIAIGHLLTMSTGLDCNDWDQKSKGQEDRVYRKKDWLQYFLDLPMVNDPGSVSNYCTMGQVLATEIIGQAAKMPIDQFADRYLFDPLDITNVSWGHTSGNDVLPSARRLYMVPRDMAKIGQLVLDGGRWHDQQVVPSDWIEESTTPKTRITGIDYGYLWWNIPFEVNGKAYQSKVATGNGGQYIFIFPELDLVAVFTGGAYNSQEDKLPFAVVRDVLLPTFTTK